MVLVCGHICEAGSRVEARQERDTAFSVGRQEAGGKHLNDEADNFQSSLRVPWSLSSICCIARTRVSEQNRVTVSGVTRIQLFCLAPKPTRRGIHREGARSRLSRRLSILAPPSPTPHHHSHSIAVTGSEARGIPPKVSNSDLPTVATAPRHLETLTLATVNACNQPPRTPPPINTNAGNGLYGGEQCQKTRQPQRQPHQPHYVCWPANSLEATVEQTRAALQSLSVWTPDVGICSPLAVPPSTLLSSTVPGADWSPLEMLPSTNMTCQ